MKSEVSYIRAARGRNDTKARGCGFSHGEMGGNGMNPKDWGKSKRELQEPCEYCVSGVCGNETIYDEMDRGFMAHVRDGILNIGVATANFHEHSEFKINYCPMCGRKLEEPTC